MQLSPSYLRDVVAGSDPGLTRLESAGGAAFATATGIAVEFLIAHARGADASSRMVAMMLGAIVAMMGSMALSGTTKPLPKVATVAGFPVALGAGMVLGVLLSGRTPVMLTGFVVVMFLAVYVRRFGVDYFFYGFMLWMGYFFASFLHTKWSTLPWQIVDVIIAALWVLALSTTVMRTNPRRTLSHVRRGFGARGRRITGTVAALLDPSDAAPTERLLRRLGSRQAGLAEAALMIEAWSAQPRALPTGWTPQVLRRRILDAQLAVNGIASAGRELIGAPAELRVAAAALNRELSLGRYESAGPLVDALDVAAVRVSSAGGDGAVFATPSMRLAASARQYIDIALRATGVATIDEDEEFTPAVALAMGNLPGSVPVAAITPVHPGPWGVLSRLDFTTRQALQVAVAGTLAIVIGRELSETRYYWAMIAAFIAFTGTGSRADTTLKLLNRVVGTLVGLVAGIGLAHATTGHTWWSLTVIVLALFCGFYLQRLSYAYMIFFITIMVSQLYSLLDEFSDHLLFLRLEETAIGACCGTVVALLVAPVSTRATTRVAQRDLLAAYAVALRALAGAGGGARGIDGLIRDVDNGLRRLTLAAAPLVRPLVVGSSPRVTRHQLTLYAGATQAVHGLADGMRVVVRGTAVDAACLDLAGIVDRLAEDPPRFGSAPAEAPAALAQLRAWTVPAGRHPARVVRNLDRLHAILCELFGPAGTAGERPSPTVTGALR
ncbi:FUSC family protein [Tsukamurella soli]|uniref:FUSC family protein n=1 Tax=Tsukamurella soli TaxID=644556 RepID=UPI00361D7D8D